MKRATCLNLVLLLALFVSACSAVPAAAPKSTPSASDGAAPAAEASPTVSVAAPESTPAASEGAVPAAKASGGTVSVGVNREPDMLDPNVGSSRYDDAVHMNIFNSPLYRDADLNFVPGLVKEWLADETNTTWTLKLREGVTFHDGTPFNAKALKFNFDRISNPETASKKAKGLLGNATTTVVDEYTLEVEYEAPYAAFLDALSTPVMGIVSPASVEKFGADVGRNPVGTGPFKFVEWIAQDRIVLERNPDYNWAPEHLGTKGAVALDQLIFRVIKEDVARVVALETGEIDAMINLPREQVARFEGDPAFVVERAVVVGSPTMLVLNGSKAPTDDVMVRQAVEHAINHDDLILAALFGVGIRAFGPLSSANPCYDAKIESKYSYDPVKASAMLVEAGWADADADGILDKGGQPLAVEYITFGGAANRRTAEVIQAQMREVGVDLTIREMESPAIQAARQAGEHNLAWLSWLGMDPAVLDVMFHSRNIGKGWNFSHYPVAELDALIEQGATEIDGAVRCEIYSKVQNLILDEGMIIPMYLQEQIVAHTAKIQGLGMSPHGDYIEWHNATKSE